MATHPGSILVLLSLRRMPRTFSWGMASRYGRLSGSRRETSRQGPFRKGSFHNLSSLDSASRAYASAGSNRRALRTLAASSATSGTLPVRVLTAELSG
jgi:hypothetical protein